MRHLSLIGLGLSATLLVAGCQKAGEAEVERAVDEITAIDESNMNDIMLTMADPAESVAYFAGKASEDPKRIDFQRGWAISLVRAKRNEEAVAAWKRVNALPQSTMDDQVDLADALIRAGNWDQADKVLDAVPPTHETFKRYRLEAIVADSDQEWDKADSFYEIAYTLKNIIKL